MVVLSYRTIKEFIQVYSDVEDQLNTWYRITEQANWENLSEIREIFNSVDYVGSDLYVFNIKGNKYRLIARIFFSVRTVYIKFIGTHKDYDRINLQSL